MHFCNALIILFLACSWINPSHAQSAITGTEEAPVFSICREIMVNEQLLGADHESIQFSLLKALAVDYPIFFGVRFTRDLAYHTLQSFDKLIPRSNFKGLDRLDWEGRHNGKAIKILAPILRDQRNDPQVQKELATVARIIWGSVYRSVTNSDMGGARWLQIIHPDVTEEQIHNTQTLFDFIETTQFKKNALDLITSLILVADQWAFRRSRREIKCRLLLLLSGLFCLLQHR